MKIGLINNLYSPYNKGGAEKVVEATARELKKQGHEVFLVTTKPLFSLEKNREDKTHYLSSLYYHLNKVPKIFRLFWHLWDLYNLKNYWALKRILKQEKPNLIITHNLKGVSGLTPRLLKKKNIFHIHVLHDIQLIHPSGLLIKGEEGKINSQINKLHIKMQRKLWLSPDVVVAPSRWLLDLHKKHGFFPDSFQRVLPNPFPEDPGTERKKFEKNTIFEFLYAGQIEEHKGVNLLIQAFGEYTSSSAKLTIIGEGSQENKIRSSDQRINFMGNKNRTEVLKAMQKADCLIVPSLCYENSPTVIYEAIQTGLPMLVSDLGGAPEIATLGAAYLFSPENKKELIAQMDEVRKNYNELKDRAEKKREKVKELDAAQYTRQILSFI